MKFKIILSFAVCIAVGFALGRLGVHFWPSAKQLIAHKPLLYSTSNQKLMSSAKKVAFKSIGWVSLLPQEEQEIIASFQIPQAQNEVDISAQVLRSIEASVDPNYQEALNSTNTVNELEGQLVSISGFIVPIDFHEDKTIRSLFVVPYFGACIHFPPPPPNQMIFAQLETGFEDIDISQAYTISGVLNQGLFEDLMGTSAYTLEVVSILPFYGQPDDFRQH